MILRQSGLGVAAGVGVFAGVRVNVAVGLEVRVAVGMTGVLVLVGGMSVGTMFAAKVQARSSAISGGKDATIRFM
jgi:hypothetical protein